MLELGAGFHPDLSERENIQLYGVLGFSRREIRRRLVSVPGFAELEDAFDVPLRFYSSGIPNARNLHVFEDIRIGPKHLHPNRRRFKIYRVNSRNGLPVAAACSISSF